MEYIPAKTIVTRTKSTSWFGTDYNMNIYRGCMHGCIYCDSRSECYHIDDFDTVKTKEDALKIIRDDLRRKVKKGVIGTGAMSDPYNKYEEQLKLTRNSLELINAFGFGVAIATKSPLVTRDIDILKDISESNPVLVKLTITTYNDELGKIIEPNAALSSERFDALGKLSAKGVFSGILMMPILPYINDSKENILNIIKKASEAGAKFIYPAFGVTLRSNQREFFYDKIDEHFQGIKSKYIKRYGNKYSCGSPNAKSLYYILSNECEKLGIEYRMENIIKLYKLRHYHSQLSLF